MLSLLLEKLSDVSFENVSQRREKSHLTKVQLKVAGDTPLIGPGLMAMKLVQLVCGTGLMIQIRLHLIFTGYAMIIVFDDIYRERDCIY